MTNSKQRLDEYERHGPLKVEVPLALKLLNKLCRDALASGAHTPDDWRNLMVAGNIQHLADHFYSFLQAATDEDHLLNLACRALMLLQLREEQK